MIRRLAIGVMFLFLAACGMQPVRDGSPASHLHAMLAGVKEQATHRKLPNGKTYCVEDSSDNGELVDCGSDLESALKDSNDDKDRIITITQQAVRRIELSLNPCGFWRRIFNRRECNVSDP